MNPSSQLKEILMFQLKQRLSKLKQDLEYVDKPPPDLKITSYGMVIGYIDIVNEKDINPERLNAWNDIIKRGNKLTIIVPKEEKLRITDILWREGLAEKISIGNYEINLFLP